MKQAVRAASLNPFNQTQFKGSVHNFNEMSSKIKPKKSDRKNRPISGKNPPGLTAVKLDYKSSGAMPEINAINVDENDHPDEYIRGIYNTAGKVTTKSFFVSEVHSSLDAKGNFRTFNNTSMTKQN